jgi:ribosome-binding protein aMBF1 (putative translation factor)
MPVKYSCDICGKELNHLKAVRIVGSESAEIVCADCWQPIERLIARKIEDHEERISHLEKFS